MTTPVRFAATFAPIRGSGTGRPKSPLEDRANTEALARLAANAANAKQGLLVSDNPRRPSNQENFADGRPTNLGITATAPMPTTVRPQPLWTKPFVVVSPRRPAAGAGARDRARSRPASAEPASTAMQEPGPLRAQPGQEAEDLAVAAEMGDVVGEALEEQTAPLTHKELKQRRKAKRKSVQERFKLTEEACSQADSESIRLQAALALRQRRTSAPIPLNDLRSDSVDSLASLPALTPLDEPMDVVARPPRRGYTLGTLV